MRNGQRKQSNGQTKKWTYQKSTVLKPFRHDHVPFMLYDDDFCCCSECEQAWEWGGSGWKVLPRRKNA